MLDQFDEEGHPVRHYSVGPKQKCVIVVAVRGRGRRTLGFAAACALHAFKMVVAEQMHKTGVIPAKAGIHFDFGVLPLLRAELHGLRLRGNDGNY